MSRRKRFIEHLEDYFNLRRFERYGLALVIVLGMLFLIVRISIPTTDNSDELQTFIDVIQLKDVEDSKSFVQIDDVSYRLRAFDPNKISKQDLFEMGLPPSAVKSIINFRTSGFQYRKPEDLLKCYGVDQLLFEEIAPYVVILDKGYSNDGRNNNNSKSKKDLAIRPFQFDPNEVTRSELESMNLPDRFINGFLNFRNAGAQFYDMEDLNKIYSLTDEIKEVIAPYLLFPDKPNNQKWEDKAKAPIVAQRFRFDPNQVSKDSLLLLGVSPSAANIWINYRNGGKVFYTTEDLRSIFGLTESKIQELAGLMDFPKNRASAPQAWVRAPQPSLNLDPNASTLEDLMEINGIGRSYANRILWRKKQLGGYFNISQIGESENLPDSTFQAVKYHFVTPTLDSLKKINVNTTRRRAFADHPYITYDRVNRIITHREFVGPKLTLAYLLKVELLSKEEARLLRPYLTFD